MTPVANQVSVADFAAAIDQHIGEPAMEAGSFTYANPPKVHWGPGRLAGHPCVQRVRYPGLADDPGHARAAHPLLQAP